MLKTFLDYLICSDMEQGDIHSSPTCFKHCLGPSSTVGGKKAKIVVKHQKQKPVSEASQVVDWVGEKTSKPKAKLNSPLLFPLSRLPLSSLRDPKMLSSSKIPQPPVFLSCCQFNTTPISQSITIRVAHAQTNRCGAKTAVAQY